MRRWLAIGIFLTVAGCTALPKETTDPPLEGPVLTATGITIQISTASGTIVAEVPRPCWQRGWSSCFISDEGADRSDRAAKKQRRRLSSDESLFNH